MSGLAVAMLVAWMEATPADYVEGMATYYAPGLMERVAAFRGIDLEGYAGGVALNRAGDLGRSVWVEWVNPATKRTERIGPLKVVDCAQRGAHFEERERANLVVELSFEQGAAWGMLGPIPVTVWFRWPGGEPEGAR